ncbi:MAG: PIN/TRAM domain-containing protein, partial [Nostoc sp.]
LDAIIIFSFILAASGIGFYSIELLPNSTLDQVTNLEALRLVVAVFGAIIGGAIGLSFQTTYRRLESQIKEMPLEVILTRAIGLVIGLLLANLM